jgi:hypothetical protein
MISILLRRRKLGRGSTAGIQQHSLKGLRAVRNWVDADIPSGTEAGGMVFRWGCTSNLPRGYESSRVVNSAKSIHWCSDKRASRLEMQQAGVPVPETWSTEDFHAAIRAGRVDGRDSFVARPSRHAQGRDLRSGMGSILVLFTGGYVSRLIDKVAEYRVFVCQNRAVWVAKKTPGNPDQVAWNVAQGGRFDNVRWGEWPIPVVKAALAAAKVSGTDFCGVDVMVDGEGNPYVLEVNSAPSQTSDYRQQCVAKAFDYIIEHGKDHFPDHEGARTRWRDLIHPALPSSGE